MHCCSSGSNYGIIQAPPQRSPTTFIGRDDCVYLVRGVVVRTVVNRVLTPPSDSCFHSPLSPFPQQTVASHKSRRPCRRPRRMRRELLRRRKKNPSWVPKTVTFLGDGSRRRRRRGGGQSRKEALFCLINHAWCRHLLYNIF